MSEANIAGVQSMPQVDAAAPSTIAVTTQSQLLNSLIDTKPKENSVSTYIFVAVMIIIVIFLIYYGYNKFVTNKNSKEGISKGSTQERDDPVVDFNLREAIRDLQNIQKRVLSTLSEATDI